MIFVSRQQPDHIVESKCIFSQHYLRQRRRTGPLGIALPVRGGGQMCIFDPDEKVDFLARQTLHYDRYSGRQYFLERVEVHDKYGLICVEQSDEYGTHTKVLLPPVYDEIHVSKISSDKAIYSKYVVYANGIKIALYTMVLDAWVPILCYDKDHIRRQISHN